MNGQRNGFCSSETSGMDAFPTKKPRRKVPLLLELLAKLGAKSCYVATNFGFYGCFEAKQQEEHYVFVMY